MRDLTGVVTLRSELVESGLTDRNIAAMVRAGELHRVRHGSYVPADLWADLDESDRHRVLVRAVLRRCSPDAVVSHVSAAVEHGALVWGVPLDEVHLTRRDGTPGRRESGVRHHSGDLPEDDVEVVNGVPVTRAARCAMEVTSQSTVEPALVTVNSLMHAGLLSPEEYAAATTSYERWPYSLPATIVKRLCDPRISSVAESRALHLCWAHGIPRPEPQVPILNEHGHEFAYVDFAWRWAGVFLEFDGRVKYERFRRPEETLEEYVLREKRREELICQLTGWVCLRITWADLEHPERTARRIRRMLDSRRGWIGA